VAVDNQNPRDGRDSEDETVIDRADEQDDPTDEPLGKGHGALKGTDTAATTDLSYAEREKGKRITM
jgi:hypothetical protein